MPGTLATEPRFGVSSRGFRSPMPAASIRPLHPGQDARAVLAARRPRGPIALLTRPYAGDACATAAQQASQSPSMRRRPTCHRGRIRLLRPRRLAACIKACQRAVSKIASSSHSRCRSQSISASKRGGITQLTSAEKSNKHSPAGRPLVAGKSAGPDDAAEFLPHDGQRRHPTPVLFDRYGMEIGVGGKMLDPLCQQFCAWWEKSPRSAATNRPSPPRRRRSSSSERR